MKELLDEYHSIKNQKSTSYSINDLYSGNIPEKKYFHYTDYVLVPSTVKLNTFYKRDNDYVLITRNLSRLEVSSEAIIDLAGFHYNMVCGYSLSIENYRAIQINNIIGDDEL